VAFQQRQTFGFNNYDWITGADLKIRTRIELFESDKYSNNDLPVFWTL